MGGLTRRGALAALTSLAGGTLAAGCSVRGGRGDPLHIASGEDGGLYAAFARLLVRQLAAADPPVAARALSTRGSAANVAALVAREADLGMVLADTAVRAVQDGREGVAGARLVALAQVYQNYTQLFTRARQPVLDVEGLRGRTVCLGADGSGAALFGERLLAVAGLVPGVDVEVVPLPLASAVAALRGGRIDATLFSGGVPLPSFAALSARVPLRLVPMDDVLPALVARHGPVYTAATVPAGAYGQDRAVATVGTANLLLATPRLPDATAQAVVTTMVERARALVPQQTRGRQLLTRRTMISTAGVPLHAGAVAAYRALHG